MDELAARSEQPGAGTPSPAAADLGGIAIRGGAIRVAGYVAGVLVSLGAATILVRHLGVSLFGRYVTVTSLIALVGGVTEAGIYVYGIREFAARAEPDRGRLLSNLLTMRIGLTIVGVACAALFALAVGYETALVLGTVVAGVGLLFQVTSDVLSISLQSQLRLGRLTLVDLSRRLIALVLIAALAATGAGLLPLIAASTAAGAAALVLLAWTTRSSARMRLAFDPPAWRALLAATLPYAIAVSIGAVYFYVTVIVMSLIASAHQTGLFATSFRVTQVVLAIPILLLTAVFPLMSRDRFGREPVTAHIVDRVLRIAVIGGVWMSLATVLGAPFIIRLIAGSPGHGAIAVLRIQALVFIPSFISTSCSLALISLRHYRQVTLVCAVALLLNVALGLVLVSALGAKGGALADVLTELAVATALTATLIRMLPGHRIPVSIVPPVVLALGLSATMLLLPIGSFARAIAGSLIYFGVLWLTRAIPPEVAEAAQRVRAAVP